MEGTACAQDAGLYSASLMKHLNVQREQGQFCDCVLRQNSDQVYPAHRCVLAASSPVLASILSSTGALVELQDPCLSDSVIVSLLDYIYTGILPSSLSQQQYHRLLTAARHLQMKELQEALRAAWRQLTVQDITRNGAEIHTLGDFSLLDHNVQDSSNVGVFEEVQINSAGLDCRIKGGGKDCNRPDGMILNITNSSCALESIDRVNAHDERDVPHFAQDWMQNGRASSEECNLHGANQDVHKNDAKSSSFINSEIQQRCTEEKLQIKSEGRRRSSSSSSTSSHSWCGAVPVIRYSRRASVVQLAEACEASQSSSCSTTPVSRSSSTDDTVKGVTTNDQNGAENQDSRNHKNENVCIIHPDLFNDYSSSSSHQLMPNSNEQSCKGLATNTDRTNQQALRDSSHDLSQDKDQSRGLKHQMECEFDQFPSKHRRFHYYEWNVSLTREGKEQIKNWGSVAPLPVQDSETGSDSSDEDGLEVEAKEEHDFSGRCLSETDIHNNHRDLNGPETNWFPNKKETISIQQEYKPNITSESGLDDAPEPRNSTSTKSTESCSCVENMISGTIDHRYHGNLHYHWLRHQDAHLSADRHSKPGSSHSSNNSTDEEEAGSFAVSGQRPLMQLLSRENTNQVLLLDMNTKPEMFGTFKHRSESEEMIRDTAAIRNPDETQSDESECRAEGFDDADEWRNGGESRLGAAREASVLEGCCSNEDENGASTGSACSPPHGPDSAQTSMPSSLSVYKPSSLPADRCAHLSSPNHQPFRCSLCDRSFSQRGSLNRHVRSHLGVRPFPCPRCPMTFSRQYRVTEHMRVHLRCPLGNGFQKTSDSFIKDHEERPQS